MGSYKLLKLLLLAPHLLGRERPIEFPRYRKDRKEDLAAFEVVLATFSKHLRFEGALKGLREWNRLLFMHSLGCVGHLSLWLRTALARMASRGIAFVTRDVLEQTRMPARQEAHIAAETIEGEAEIALFSEDRPRTQDTQDPASRNSKTRKHGKKKTPPFQAKPARHKAGGRA